KILRWRRGNRLHVDTLLVHLREPCFDRCDLGSDRLSLLPIDLARCLVGEPEESIALRVKKWFYEVVGRRRQHVAVNVDRNFTCSPAAPFYPHAVRAGAGGSTGIEHAQCPPVFLDRSRARQACQTL